MYNVLGNGAIHCDTKHWERSSFGVEIRNLVSDVRIECEVPLSHPNGAIMEAVYVRI